MADKEIGDLTAASALTGAETVHVVQGGNSRRTTTQGIADLGGGAASLADLTDVDLTGVVDGDTLVYEASSQKFYPSPKDSVVPGGAWELAGSWTWSTNVANVDFTGLGAYTDILILFRNVSAVGSSFRGIRLSIDNGATFYSSSGEYVSLASSGAETNQTYISLITSPTTLARSGESTIRCSNVNGAPKYIECGTILTSNIFVGSNSPVNAVRCLNSDGSNFTAGSIYVFGRR